MLLDALLAFVSPGFPLSLVGGAGISIPSPLTYDFLGLGVGVAPQGIIGNRTIFGQADAMGVGEHVPQLVVNIGTALTTGNGALLNVALQAAADLGAAGNYQPGTWQTLEETGPMAVANLTATKEIARFVWVPPFPEGLRPRYLRLLFSPIAAVAAPATPTNFTAGTIANAVVTLGRDDQFQKFSVKNYNV